VTTSTLPYLTPSFLLLIAGWLRLQVLYAWYARNQRVSTASVLSRHHHDYKVNYNWVTSNPYVDKRCCNVQYMYVYLRMRVRKERIPGEQRTSKVFDVFSG